LVRKISEPYDSRMSRLLAASLLLLWLGPARLAAQGSERWQIRLDQDEYVWDVRLLRLEGETLLVRQADSMAAVPVGRISEIRLLRKTEMQLGDGAAAMSALTGRDDEVYDLSPLDFAERLRAIQKILLYHPPEP
jgi:hypothetical protein